MPFFVVRTHQSVKEKSRLPLKKIIKMTIVKLQPRNLLDCSRRVMEILFLFGLLRVFG